MNSPPASSTSKITWDENVTDYSATQTYTYDGLDLSGALTGDEVEFGYVWNNAQGHF